MSYVAKQTPDIALERRVEELERRFIEVEWNAKFAFEEHRSLVKEKHDFWWAAFRYVAAAQIGFALGLLLFGRHN